MALRNPNKSIRMADQQAVRMAAANIDSWRAGLTSSQRGYNYKWAKARATFLRAHPLCAYCARIGVTTAATVVDHITPHKGDQCLFWDEANWQPLCSSCHSSLKQAEERAERGRRRVEGKPSTDGGSTRG